MLIAAAPLQAFELLRDRIAAILTLEMNSQATLQGDQDINAEVYTQRLPPFDTTDLPCINVNLANGDYPSKTAQKADSTYTFNIDIFTQAATTSSIEGGQKSSEVGQRIAGTIRYVLSSPIYRLLNFAAPSLKHTEVAKMMNPDYLERESVNIRITRLVFIVDTIEGIEFNTTTPFATALTKVLVDGTSNGFKYQIDATP